MLRAPLSSERIERVDPITGIKVMQITSYPTPSVALPYEWPSITPDNQRLILMCQRAGKRGAPWDIFRCDTDGLNLFQLTERDQEVYPPVYDKGNAPVALLSLDGKTVYVVWNGDSNIYSVDVESGRQDVVGSIAGICPEGVMFQHMRLNIEGDMLYVVIRKPNVGTARIDLDSGEAVRLDVGGLLWACLPEGRRLLVWRNTPVAEESLPDYITLVRSEGTRGFWSTDEDGGDERFFSSDAFAHGSVLGKTNRLQGCGLPPERCIWINEAGKSPVKLVNGPYFWHSGASWDGDWIVSDTNWPDRGLQLIHVASQHFRTLCHAGATQEHIRAGHPHPALSHDGRIAVFTSDRTGIAQVFTAFITDEFRESIIAGDLGNPYDKWM